MAHNWRPLFNRFAAQARISSKELSSGADARGSKIDMWTSQERFLDMVLDGLSADIHDFTCLKSRQQGITTISLLIDIFWLAMHPGIIGALVVDTETNRDTFREVLRRYVQSFPKGFLGKSFALVKGGDNRSFMKFSNGSRLDFLVAGTTNKANWGESRGYSLAHLTEVASYGNPDGLSSFEEGLAETNPDRLFMKESPLALDTPLATPIGWTTMGEVKEGDFLFADDGRPCKVVGTSPIMIGHKCYEVKFSNGDTIIADEDHLWQVRQFRYYTNQQWSVKTLPTKFLSTFRDRIRVTEPLALPDADLPIDPYLLGAWLGDGRTAEVRMCAGDQDIDEMRQILESRGHTLGPISRCGDRIGEFVILGQRSKFTRLGLLGNKHIPDIYLRASEPQRRALLAGLMDTDGSIDKKAFQCNFTSTLPRLASDVSELLVGLGIKAIASQASVEGSIRQFPRGNISVCKASTRLVFHERPDRQVFQLERKRRTHNAERNHTHRKTKFLSIVSVTEVASVPVKCVAVDAPSHLFLAGRTMIPTHNTAKGMNHWRDRWQEAGRDSYTRRRLFVGWWAKSLNSIAIHDRRFALYGQTPPNEEEKELIEAVHEQYDWPISVEQLAWYRWRQANQSQTAQSLDQNQPWTAEQAFVLSGYSFFQTRKIQSQFDGIMAMSPPLMYEGFRFWLGNDFFGSTMESITDPARRNEVELRVWEQPVANATYVIGVDPAMGRSDNKDRHAISIWRCFADRLVQVAEYADNHCETRQAAWVLAYIAGAYKNCMINLEITGGYGQTVMTELDNVRNQLRAEVYAAKVEGLGWGDFLALARWYLYHKPDSPGAGYVYNWNSTFDAKNRMLSAFRDAHSTDVLEIRSVLLLEEMSIVVQDGSEIGAPGKQKDDRVFGGALACEAWNRWFRPQMLAEGYLFDMVMRLESGEQTAAESLIARLVQNTLKQIAAGEEEEPMTPEREFLEERGLA